MSDDTTGVEPVPSSGQTLETETPEVPDVPEETLEDVEEPTLVPQVRIETQCQQTDDALIRWRNESLQRKEDWEEAHARAEAEAALRWGFTKILAGAATIAVVVAGAILLVVVQALSVDRAPPVVVAAQPAPVEVAEPVADPVEEPEALADDAVAAVAPVEEPLAEEPVEAPEGAVDVVPGTIRLWTEPGHYWVEAVVQSEEPAFLQWLDADGRVALEEMACGYLLDDGTRVCKAGRTERRTTYALKGGASAGDWTVRVCGSVGGCTPLGTFEVAPL